MVIFSIDLNENRFVGIEVFAKIYAHALVRSPAFEVFVKAQMRAPKTFNGIYFICWMIATICSLNDGMFCWIIFQITRLSTPKYSWITIGHTPIFFRGQ